MQKVVITFLVALLINYSAAAEEKKVAVFDPAGNADNAIKEIVRELISSVIVNAEGYTVLERQLINRVLEEHRMQVGGLIDDAQVVEMGKLMGANLAFVTSVTALGSNHFVSGKMIDVQTARIEMQSTGITQRGLDDIVDVVQSLVRGMITGTVSDTPVTSTPPAQQETPAATPARTSTPAPARTTPPAPARRTPVSTGTGTAR